MVDATFKYLRFQREGTPHQKTVSKKQLVKAIEEAHEFLEGAGKIVKIKPAPRMTTITKPSEVIHMISTDF